MTPERGTGRRLATLAIWRDGRAYRTTGAEERKARDLVANPAVVLPPDGTPSPRGWTSRS